MKLSKVLAITCLTLGTINLAGAKEVSKLSIGTIERNDGGRQYTIGLSNKDITKITIKAPSPENQAKLKIRAVKFANKDASVSLFSKQAFVDKNIGLDFNVEALDSFPALTKPLDCQAPCIVIDAEAYSSNNISLQLIIESEVEKTYMTSVKGLSPISGTLDSLSTRGKVYKAKDFSIAVGRSKVNSDESITFSNLELTKGDKTLGIKTGPSGPSSDLCKVFIDRQDVRVVDHSSSLPTEEEEFLYILSDAGSVDAIRGFSIYNNYVLNSVTCK